MPVKFQYNKTSLQALEKQLKMRVRALPTIKNKESALRSEVKKAKAVADDFDCRLASSLDAIHDTLQLYDEYAPDILSIKDVRMSVRKIAGVQTPVLDGVNFAWSPSSVIEIVKSSLLLGIFEVSKSSSIAKSSSIS